MESADARKDSLVTDRVSSPEGQAGTAISSNSPSVENGHARQEDTSISVDEIELENETAIAAEEAIEQTNDATVVSDPVDTLDLLDSKKLVVHTTVCNGTMSNTITVSSNGMMSSVNSASTIHKRTGIKQMRSTPYTKTTPSNSTPSSSSYPVMGYQLLPIVPQQLFFPVSYLPHQTSQISKNQRYQLDEPILSSTNLYIRGLPETCTDEDLTNMCIQYGKIVSTKAILDKKTTLCKGYGFVDFQNPQDAQKALDTLQSQGVMVQFARLQEQDPTNLYLSNLPKTFSEKHLEQILSPFGTIISTRILREANGYSRGVGFVRLDSQEHCEKAIDGLNGTLLPGATEPLNIKFADSGSYRKKTSTGQYKDATFPDVFSSGPGLWKDYVVPPDYVYDVPPVLPHNGHNSSRLLHQQILSGTSPYLHPSSQVSGYQVQGGGTTTGTWPNSYYITPANSALGNSHATNGGDNLHTLASHMSQLQLSSASTNGGTTYTAQPHNHQYTLPSGSASGTHSAPPIPTHTAHYTQQPPGWTISPTTHYIPQHS